MLVKIKRKAKLLLAVKKQPLNSQTEAEITSQGPKTEGFMGKACLEGRACQKEGSGELASAQSEISQAKAHILRDNLPTKEEKARDVQRDRTRSCKGDKSNSGGWQQVAARVSSWLFVPKQKAVKGKVTD